MGWIWKKYFFQPVNNKQGLKSGKMPYLLFTKQVWGDGRLWMWFIFYFCFSIFPHIFVYYITKCFCTCCLTSPIPPLGKAPICDSVPWIPCIQWDPKSMVMTSEDLFYSADYTPRVDIHYSHMLMFKTVKLKWLCACLTFIMMTCDVLRFMCFLLAQVWLAMALF